MPEFFLPNGDKHRFNNQADLQRRAKEALQKQASGDETNSEVIREMRLNRQANRKTATPIGGLDSSQVMFATGRSHDPMFYWRQANLPYEYQREDQLIQIRNFARLLMITHPVLSACIEIYSKWPLVGMTLKSKDKEIEEFYTTLFMDQLDYEEYLPQILKEYWCALPGTLVTTSEGPKAIDHIVPDDMVLTHKGRFSPVTHQIIRKIDSTVVTVETESTLPLQFTKGHEFWVRQFLGVRDGESISYLPKDYDPRFPVPKMYDASQVTQEAANKLYFTGWVPVEEVREGDWLYTPINHRIEDTKEVDVWDFLSRNDWVIHEPYVENYNLSNQLRRQRKARHQKYVDEGVPYGAILRPATTAPVTNVVLKKTSYQTTPEFLEFLGLFLLYGECGDTYRKGIKFSACLGRVEELASSVFDLPLTDDTIYCRPLWEWFRQYTLFPSWVLKLDPDKSAAAALPSLSTYRTKNRELAQQFGLLIRQAGFFSHIQPSGDEYVITRIEQDSGLGYWTKITKVSQESYQGIVYDIGVKDDYSFVANDVAVHNCVGEAFPLGQFNEVLGIWESDELIQPNDVNVISSPFLTEPRFEMKIPEEIKKIITEREPEWEFKKLTQSYPELVRAAMNDESLPVSNILMKHIAYKQDTFHHRGLPILLKAFRSVYQEEMLNAALDSIASRLYTPLILVKLGCPAGDMGTDAPWIPDAGDVEQFNQALDTALAADFRVLTSHFATDIEQVFGREAMPDFGPDFDRIIDRQLMVFGLSRTMLLGAASGETYAADALNRDLISQILIHAQKKIKSFFEDRCKVVAEAQGHYDYEERNGKRYPIMEEVWEVDEDGSGHLIEKPKLLYPELHFDVLNLQDENITRGFVEQLREANVPISMRTRMVSLPIDLEEEMETMKQEAIDQAVAAQETRKETFLALRAEGLPIEDDLQQDFGPHAQTGIDPSMMPQAPEAPLPTQGTDSPVNPAILTPGPQDYQQADEQGLGGDAPPGQAPAPIIMMPRNPSRPDESDEQRGRMPKPASHTAAHTAAPDNYNIHEIYPPDPSPSEGPHRLTSGPRITSRPDMDPDIPLDEQRLKH